MSKGPNGYYSNRAVSVRCRGFTAWWEPGGVYADIFRDGRSSALDVLNRQHGDGSLGWTDAAGLHNALGEWVKTYGRQYR